MTNLIFIPIILLAAYYLGIFKGAPFVPTDNKTVQRMIGAAMIKPGMKVVDLGSGDGRIVIAAAKAGAESHGYEINPLLVLWTKYQIRRENLTGRAFVHWKNFWFVDFSPYQIVMLFGITGIMSKLEQKLKAELKPGSFIISNTFKFPNWESNKVQNVFVYRIEKTSEK